MGTRCFVAIPLPEAYQEALGRINAAWKGQLRSHVTWTRQGNWHLTLSFLGELSPEMENSVRDALHQVAEEPFPLQAGGAGFFPPGKAPRVVWIGVNTGAEKSVHLAGRVEQVLLPLGFPPSSRPFRPHLTVARVKKSRSDDWSALLKWLQDMSWPEFQVDRFVLYASQLTPRGPIYTRLQEYPLIAKA